MKHYAFSCRLPAATSLIHECEERHVFIPDIYGVELLKVLMGDRHLKQKDRVPVFKTESIVSEVLAGKRQRTREHIEMLAAFFCVSPAVFFASRP